MLDTPVLVSGPLTDDQIAAFERDGYVSVPGLFSAEEIESIDHWAREVETWPEVPGRYMMYFEETADDPPKRVLNRIEDVMPYHPNFRSLAMSEKMLGACGQLLGEPAVLFKDKINFKKAGGGGFAPHQDVQAGWARYASLHITALVTIDATTRDNGCLEMARSFGYQQLIGQEWTPLTDDQLANIDFIPIESKPGDAVFFDSFAPHQSGPNLTGEPRRVLYYTYNKASEGDHLAQYYADKRASYPPDIEREEGKEYAYRV